jgi:hypothetical protein
VSGGRRIVAGVDIGNSTTEVVVAEVTSAGTAPLAWDRTLTRGIKGSSQSVEVAGALATRLARQVGGRLDVCAVAPLRPVSTRSLLVPMPDPDLGRLWLARVGAPTAGGQGVGVGRPVALSDLAAARVGDVVAVGRLGDGFREVAAQVSDALAHGVNIVAVVLEGDEAVLVANRLSRTLPVVDGVEAGRMLRARAVAVEVGPPGRPVRRLSDALALATGLSLEATDPGVAAVCRALFDVSNAVVALDAAAPSAPAPSPSPVLRLPGGTVTLDALVAQDAPAVRTGRLVWPVDGLDAAVDDVAVLDLDRLAEASSTRAGSTQSRAFALALLHQEAAAEVADRLSDAAQAPVVTAASETSASRAGALTTPGASPTTAVVDLGGGTVDVIVEEADVVLAGAGELVTVATSQLLGIPRGAAEWAKRGACHRAESPHLVVGEDGSRTLLPEPLPGHLVGGLVAPGPSGWLGLGGQLAASEWRALRRNVKQSVLAAAVERALRRLGGEATTWVVVGGPAGDDEVVATLTRRLPADSAVGRADVAGGLGHRYAVAYGLVLAAAERGAR